MYSGGSKGLCRVELFHLNEGRKVAIVEVEEKRVRSKEKIRIKS